MEEGTTARWIWIFVDARKSRVGCVGCFNSVALLYHGYQSLKRLRWGLGKLTLQGLNIVLVISFLLGFSMPSRLLNDVR